MQKTKIPCPDCGSHAKVYRSGGVMRVTSYCGCTKCGLRTCDFTSEKAAILKWEKGDVKGLFYQYEFDLRKRGAQ